MPIKLTSKQYQVIAIVVVVAVGSLGIGVKYFWRAFPEAAIEFRVNREGSEPLARSFLEARGARLQGYRHAAVFDYDDDSKVYLERTQGLERMNQLTKGPIRLWRWSHRWFKPQQKEEFRIDVTPAGEVVGFDHEIPETAPGASLEGTAAREIAEKFLRDVVRRDPSALEFVEAETEKRPARADHEFTWKQKDVDLGDGSLRVQVEVDGDQVAGYREFVKVPEQWSRDYERLRSRNNSAQIVDEVFFGFLFVAMVILLIARLRDRDVPVRMSLGFGLVAAVLNFLGQMNDFSIAQFAYRTTDSYSSFMAGYVQRSLLSALGIGAWIFFLVASSEPAYRQGFPRLPSLRRTFSWQGVRARPFFMANVVGIGMTFFFFAYQTIFYLTANQLGAWAPSDVNYSDLLNTRIPWVWVLFIGFMPAVSEEMQFRAFAIPFLKKLFRSGPLALVLAAFIWGFLHSAYPNQPFFIRGVEVGLGGIVIGVIMLRFGVVATMIWHYSVDALYTAFLLLRSHNNYLMVSGGVTAGIMLVPLIVALAAYWKSGTFLEDAPLTNEREGVSRAARAEAPAVPAAPLAYQPLSQRRLALAGALTGLFVVLASLPVDRFGKGVELRTTRQDAVRVADAYLESSKVKAGTYRRVAWIDENQDPMALRYLLERRTVAQTDQIYRHATRLLLWEVRYFRPLEKEEHLVFVDADQGRVFAYRHVLPEDAPGAALAPDAAQAMAEKYATQEGYHLAEFDLQDSQRKAQPKTGRVDYVFIWQAKPGDPRNVDEALYRLEVNINGDQVVGFSRHFKLPEAWVRERTATRVANQVLRGVLALLVVGLVTGGIIILVKQIRAGQIRWRPAAWIGAALVPVMAFSEWNQLPTIYQQYDTSIPLATFKLFVGVSFLVIPLLAGLSAWLLVGLAASLYPSAWRLFNSLGRSVWRRDAIVAMVICLAAGAGLNKLGVLVASRFHAIASVGIGLVPNSLDASWPGAGFFLAAMQRAILSTALAGLMIYVIRVGWARRAWWLWVGGLLLLVGLGPSGAHSKAEFLVGWATGLVSSLVAIGIVRLFFRDNVLAYAAAAFCLSVAQPLVSLLSEPASFYRWNGALLAALTLMVLAWLLLGGGEPAGER